MHLASSFCLIDGHEIKIWKYQKIKFQKSKADTDSAQITPIDYLIKMCNFITVGFRLPDTRLTDHLDMI